MTTTTAPAPVAPAAPFRPASREVGESLDVARGGLWALVFSSPFLVALAAILYFVLRG